MSQQVEEKVPDIGGYSQVPVIEVCVRVGDTVVRDDALVTLESDKATMDVPATVAGVVREVRVAVGDRLSQGAVVAVIDTDPDAAHALAVPVAAPSPAMAAPAASDPLTEALPTLPSPVLSDPGNTSGTSFHASPSVRFFARELGVDLAQVTASGPNGRVLKEDVTAYVKSRMAGGGTAGHASVAAGGLDLLPWPKVDFGKFGPVESRPLSRIQALSARNLARNWVMIPAVTYHEDADITDLEAFRLALNQEDAGGGVRMTLLPFLMKVCERALRQFPQLNSSLDKEGGEGEEAGTLRLVLKQYVHIAFAADTPAGLVVPVIRNVDQKSVRQIAVECAELARKAREGKLSPGEMNGACFTVSSLGGIGGGAFSPIINAPEVAILGVGRAVNKPVWNGQDFVPRLMLPLSLTADHRVVDGALATRFNVYVAQLLADVRRLLL